MPAAKPTKKITSTRATADETALPSHDRAIVIRFRTIERGGLFDGSAARRPLENSDSDDVRLEFIGIPPSNAYVPQRQCDGTVTLPITVAESLGELHQRQSGYRRQ